MKKSAIISDCGQYRYMLKRIWNENVRPLTFLMINPSSADAVKDDPTIRKCINIAMHHQYGGIIVINLFAYRTAKVKELTTIKDPIGPDNDRYFYEAMKESHNLVLAWGNGVNKLPMMGFNRVQKILKELSIQWGRFKEVKVFCLGQTTFQNPKHPLFLKNTQKLVPLRIGKQAVHLGPPLETNYTLVISLKNKYIPPVI